MKNKEIFLSGKPSIDKPWLKYYTEEQINEKIPEKICYKNVLDNNIDYLDDIAFEYIGNKITYKELFENIDKTEQAFISLGIKKGDVVTICSITTPELIYSFYALNKIGAISNMLDMRYNEKAIESFIHEVNSKYLITLDLCYDKVKNIKKDLKGIIFVNPKNSIPNYLKLGANLFSKDNIPYNDFFLKWNNIIDSRNLVYPGQIDYVENNPITIVHTGGTTGIPKGVMLTNENLNCAVLQIKNSNIDAERQYRFLNILPPFVAYGLVLGINVPLTLGWNSSIIPKFDPNKFDKLLLKYKPNGVMGIPSYFESIMKSKKMNKKDLYYIKNILLGGDRIKGEFENRLNKFLLEHNCNAGVGKGYSMTEASSCATFSSKIANELESVGIPLCKTTISIFESGTTKELSYNEVGEVYIKTPTMMNGYYNNTEETNKVKVLHEDGYWIHSGDLGYMNEDGLLFIKDRIKRMIIRSGFKVFPSEIENLFLTHEAIESCAVVGIPDTEEINVPKACIVLKDDYKDREEEIKQELIEMFKNSKLPFYFEPVKFDFMEKLPLTNIGKVDFLQLEKEETDVKILKKTNK